MIETKQRDLLALALAAVVVPATAWWVMAGCSSNPKKPETPAQPAPAEPAPEQVAKEAQPAGPVGEPGTYTIANLERVLAAGSCENMGNLSGALARVNTPGGPDEVAKEVSNEQTVQTTAVTEWLVLVKRYQDTCDVKGPAGTNAEDLLLTHKPLAETTAERAIKDQRCVFLASIDHAKAWPYTKRFADEVGRSDFQGAEITRVLWVESLQGYLGACSGGLTSRDRVTAEAGIKKLERIIGLDDDILIDLRSKMVAALKNGHADAVLSFSRAINEREKAIDGSHAAEYDAKLASIEAMMIEQKKAAATGGGGGGGGKKGQPAGGGTKPNAAETLGQVANTAEQAARAAKATKTMMKAFGL